MHVAASPQKSTAEGYYISTDKTRLNVKLIHDYLSTQSYWSQNIPFEVVKRAIGNSTCFGIYNTENEQVGFARVVTDAATFAYLADVFVLPEHRGKGLSKLLMQQIKENEQLAGLRRWVLATRDAHSLYAQYGFTPLARPERFMELHNPHVYSK